MSKLFGLPHCKCGEELLEYELEHVDDHDGEVYHTTLIVLAHNDHDAGVWDGFTQSEPYHDTAQLDTETGQVLGDWHLGLCPAQEQVCRECGCMGERLSETCPDDFGEGCHWVEADLCSGCVERQEVA